MENYDYTFSKGLNEVSASSSGGAPFLVSYGVTFILTGVLALLLPRETSALLVMFQGAVALPIALWLEKRLSSTRMSSENPLTKLSMYLAVSQALAIPFLIVVYNIDPGQIPVVMAGLGGVHFLPYAWLHRTRIYVFLGAALALGAFGLVLGLKTLAYTAILFYVGVVYLAAAPFVYQHAKKLI